MKRILRGAVPLLATLAIAACSAGGSSGLPGTSDAQARTGRTLPHWLLTGSAKAACTGSRIGQAQCDVLLENRGAHPNAVAGWTPAQLETAYDLPSSTDGSGQTVAIVDAYDNPDVASNLATYRANFGLPAANFTKYNQTGQQSNYPSGSVGWGLEIDLDTQMVSTGCPNCKIILVEANSSTWSNLEAAEAEAVKLGATIVTNSYSGSGASESSYDTSGVTYVASSGDSGYGLYDPATFKSVVAAGGTNLAYSARKGYTETVWDDSGGGCSSTGESKPSWQSDPGCSYRTGSDVSADAVDVAEYDSYGYGGWVQVDGTSISSPLLASVFALAGNSTSQDGGENIWNLSASQKSSYLHDITKGNDGCSGVSHKYLCKAGTGQFGQFAGPTGWGSPNGIGAF
jgi:hypothetical protein